MTVATMTSKGQVTIPIELRDELNLTAGPGVEFVKLRDGGCAFYPLTGSTATYSCVS